MGAYKKDISRHICIRCRKVKATCEVFNRYNALMGYHCARCARGVVKELDDADRKRITTSRL